MVGQFVRHDFHKATSESTSIVQQCPNGHGGGTQHGFQLDQTEYGIVASTTYSVSFITLPGGGGYEFFNANNYDPDNPAKGILSLIDYQSEDSPCTGLFVAKDFSRTSPSDLFPASSLSDASGDMTDPNVVSGSFSMDEPGDPPRHLEFRWKFTRQVGAP